MTLTVSEAELMPLDNNVNVRPEEHRRGFHSALDSFTYNHILFREGNNSTVPSGACVANLCTLCSGLSRPPGLEIGVPLLSSGSGPVTQQGLPTTR